MPLVNPSFQLIAKSLRVNWRTSNARWFGWLVCVKWHGVLEGRRKIGKVIIPVHNNGDRINEPTTGVSLCLSSQEWMPRCRENNWTKAVWYPVRFSSRPQHFRTNFHSSAKKSLEHAKDVDTCFVDLGKVYDRVPCEKLWGMSQEYGVDGCLLLAVK